MATLEFFFDYGSPWSYFAFTQVPKVAAAAGADGALPADAARRRLQGDRQPIAGRDQCAGQAGLFEVGIRNAMRRTTAFPSPTIRIFPINTMHLMRGAAWAELEGRLLPYSTAIFQAMWVEPRNLGDPARVGTRVVARPASIQQRSGPAIERADVKQRLRETTDEAVRRGVFGAPTFFVGDRDVLWAGPPRISSRSALSGLLNRLFHANSILSTGLPCLAAKVILLEQQGCWTHPCSRAATQVERFVLTGRRQQVARCVWPMLPETSARNSGTQCRSGNQAITMKKPNRFAVVERREFILGASAAGALLAFLGSAASAQQSATPATATAPAPPAPPQVTWQEAMRAIIGEATPVEGRSSSNFPTRPKMAMSSPSRSASKVQ